jgi:hypothetical protein
MIATAIRHVDGHDELVAALEPQEQAHGRHRQQAAARLAADGGNTGQHHG